MEENTASPLPKKEQKKLTFLEAIEELRAGKRITKLDWNNEYIFGQIVNDILMLHKEDGIFYQWILSKGDIEGEDYIVLTDVN